ncbi:hypothetical protein CU308_06640 [Prochlorococcus marinus str. MU1410]|nr:hypothetical protein [Prochlorococcus marinus str. MU1410]
MYGKYIYKKFLRKFIVATIGAIGLFSSQKAFATIYTHNLNYTHNDNSQTSTLTGRISFDDADADAQTPRLGNTTFDTGFITDLTFTYTDSSGNESTLSYSDFTPGSGAGQFATYRINHDGSVNFNVANLKAELTDLAFSSDVDCVNNAFCMTANTGLNFSVDIDGVDDFTLNTTSYHSPAPLPFLGLLTSFGSIKKLKNKYKKKYNL